MNVVREINKINERELELGVKGSWHDEYKDSAYVFVGGLAYDLTEGDVVTIMSQYGEVMDINMPRDQETGKPKGFCFLMYEDQRSTVLAVDNMTGAQVLGRTIRVDHCKKYEQRGSKNENGDYVEPEEPTYNVMPPTLEGSSDESSSDSEGDDVDDEDPMAAYLRQQKKTKKITDGKKRKRDGESKEDKKARKDEKRRRKDERDKKRKEREEKKGRSKAKDNDQSGSRSRSPGLMKREREESRVSNRRHDDRKRDESRSRDGRDERDDRRSRHRDLDEREERHRSRGEDDRGERRHPRLQDDGDERESSRSRLPTDLDDRDRNAIRPRSERDEPRSRLPDLAHRDDRARSRPRDDRLDRDDRDYRSRNDTEQGRNENRRGYDDRRPPRHDQPLPRSVDRSEDSRPKVDPRMNPARTQLLAGGAGRGGYNGGPPRDDRFGRR